MIDEKQLEEFGCPVDEITMYDDMSDIVHSKPRRETYFEKVSFKQFKKDWIKAFGVNDELMTEEEINAVIQQVYDGIELPTRSSSGSAGYDFGNPMWFKLNPQEKIMIPTGIRCYMSPNFVLMIYPRSGLGVKNGFVPMNLTGIIDSDYALSDNEGHIIMHMINGGDKVMTVEQGKAFCQGVLMSYFITDNDEADGVRNGGFGSSDI